MLPNEVHDKILDKLCDPAAAGEKGYNVDALHYVQTDPLVRANIMPLIARHGVHFTLKFSVATKADEGLHARMGSDAVFRDGYNHGREVTETAYDLLTAFKPHPLVPFQDVTLKIVKLKQHTCYGFAQLVMVGYNGLVMTDTTRANF